MIDPAAQIYSAFDWLNEIKPALNAISFPADLNLGNIVLVEQEIPSDHPPVSSQGEYIFAIMTARSGTLDFNSNLSLASFTVN